MSRELEQVSKPVEAFHHAGEIQILEIIAMLTKFLQFSPCWRILIVESSFFMILDLLLAIQNFRLGTHDSTWFRQNFAVILDQPVNKKKFGQLFGPTRGENFW